ncbi:Oidioi.mRNA.OKI2018_I69.PAR.g8746.t1.cds [Oikopleura dioica]|uniref:Oidioi.mRNA.OKI2018_I69.PAR.g8746.t1.cds n=1 Tax=Oikopleura dioica TaxID=34765 RepID=A0ABN7RHD5_OIKDI|nr:Oidioi.mRNA.OKI2018_I69.PAR.g8746.t1.cds [Oikopleura dioica]
MSFACDAIQSSLESAYDVAKSLGGTYLDVFCSTKATYESSAALLDDCEIDWPCSNAGSMTMSILMILFFSFLMMKN